MTPFHRLTRSTLTPCGMKSRAGGAVTPGRGAGMIALPRMPPPPDVVLKNLLASNDPDLPHLRRIIRVPVFTPTGSLLRTHGFDVPSGIYYDPEPGIVVDPVPEQPTADDVEKAKRLIIKELLADFPFVSDAD